MQLQCPNCKAQNRFGAKFCQSCGQALQPVMLQNRYQISDVLGQGGFGAVYLAQDVRLGRDCVVKQMLLPERAAHPSLEAWQAEVDRVRDNFQREAQSLTTLNQPGHASIPEIYDFFAEQSGNYLVMKHIRGEDLAARLNRTRQPIPLQLGIEIARQIVSALEYMHARVDPQTQWPAPVLHRDIKPANIIVGEGNRAWLVDFGLSKAQSGVAPGAAARQTTAAGTVGYAPPEQYEGKTEPRSDVYALAATLYHLLTNDDPQDHAFSFPLLDRLPSDVNQLLRRALESDVSRRISSTNFRQKIQARVTAAGNAFFWLDGTASNTPEDLAEPANRFWSEARGYFRQDRWEKWFAERNRNDVLNIMKSVKQTHAGDPDKALDAFLRQICPTFPQPVLRLSSPDLQFGDLPWQTTRTLGLEISNGGGGWLSGRFVKTPIWATPNPDSFATHDRQTIKVTVDAGKLTPQTYRQTGSLEIAAGSGSMRIAVAVTVPTPQIGIAPMRLDLGTEGWSDTLHGTLTIRNMGGSACESTVRCDDVWLDIQPDHFRCEPGQSVSLAAKADVRQMVIGVNQLKVAVDAQAGGWQDLTAAQVIANRRATVARWKHWGPTLDWAALGAFVSVMIFCLIRWSGPNLVRVLAFSPIGALFLSGVAAYAGSVLNARLGPQAWRAKGRDVFWPWKYDLARAFNGAWVWAGLTLIGIVASTKADLTLGVTAMVTGAGLTGALIPGVRHRPGRATRKEWSGLFALAWSLFALWQMVGLLMQPDNSWRVDRQVAISQSDVTAAVFSNDGSQLALGATDGAVTVWSTQDGKPGTRLVGQPAPIRTIAFARDGSLIAASACDADCTQPRIGWWQASDGQLIHMESVTGTAVTGLAFTPERSILAIGVCRQSTDTALCREGAAQLWSTANPTFLDTRPGVGIALSPNVTAPLLASAEKGTVVVRQLLTNVISHTLPMSETINHLIFSPDGKWLAASGDRLTRVWRVVDGASVGDFSRSTASTSNVSFSPDGRLMAQIDGMAIKVWQVADHALRRELLTPYALYAVAFASDGTLLSYAATDRTLLHWWVGK